MQKYVQAINSSAIFNTRILDIAKTLKQHDINQNRSYVLGVQIAITAMTLNNVQWRRSHRLVALTAAVTCTLHLSRLSQAYVLFPTSIGVFGGVMMDLRKEVFCQNLAASADEASWSSTANGKRHLGVRNRVKAVLKKARKRTKIDTYSDGPSNDDEFESEPQTAEISSLGTFQNLDNDPSTQESRRGLNVNASRIDFNSHPSQGENTIIQDKTSNPKSPELQKKSENTSSSEKISEEPLPFELPELSSQQIKALKDGERIQYQKDMGREGSGFVVLDVDAPPDVVWDCLLDFHSYPELIPTVREIKMFTNTHLSEDYRAENPVDYQDGTVATLKHGVPSVTRAAFTLSKFRLNIAAIHRYNPHPKGDYMIFTLDPACTNIVLQSAKGIWHTQADPYGDGSVRLLMITSTN